MAELGNLTADALNNVTYIDASFAPKAGTDAGLMLTEQGSAYISIHNGGIWHLTPMQRLLQVSTILLYT